MWRLWQLDNLLLRGGGAGPLIFGCRLDRPGEPEVAQFNVAIVVQEHVAWLQISVENVRRMDILGSTEQIIDDDLNVLLTEVDFLLLSNEAGNIITKVLLNEK